MDLVIAISPMNFQNTVTITTGLSDFFKMVITVLKTAFVKLIPKKVIYMDYKIFNRSEFKTELDNNNISGNKIFFKVVSYLEKNLG